MIQMNNIHTSESDLKNNKTVKRHCTWVLPVLSAFYGLCAVLGREAVQYGEIRLNKQMCLRLVLYIGIFFAVILLLWTLMERFRYSLEVSSKDIKPVPSKDIKTVLSKSSGSTAVAAAAHGRLRWLFYSAFLWVCYFVIFLGVYPGFFLYDAHDELQQFIDGAFTTHHPMLHVLLLGNIIERVYAFTGNYNTAIAVYILLQMTLISIIFGMLTDSFERRTGIGRGSAAVILLWLGLFPVHSMYVLCSVKDSLFSVFLAAAVLVLEGMLLADTRHSCISTAGSSIGHLTYIRAFVFVIAAVLMMQLRNNGIYAYAVFMLTAIALLLRSSGKASLRSCGARTFAASSSVRNSRITLCILLVLPLLISFGLTHGLNTRYHAKDAGRKEMLAVPIQQLARMYAYDRDSLTIAEQEQLEHYLPAEAMMRYSAACADPVKLDFSEEAYAASPAQFWKLYFSLVRRHPLAAVNAWIMTSHGLWYPNAVINGYAGHSVFTFVYGDSSYFGYETELPGVRDSRIPAIDAFYHWLSLDPQIQRMPFIHLFFSPGAAVWLFLFLLGFLFYTKKTEAAIAYLLPFFVILTVFLGPMSLVRYVYYLWILNPFLLLEVLKAASSSALKASPSSALEAASSSVPEAAPSSVANAFAS